MKKIYIRNLFVGLSFIVVLSSAIMSASGPIASLTNAPGEQSCTSCHGGSVITSGNSNLNNFRFNGNFTGNGYLPDSTYTMELTFKQSGKSKFGFQVTCLDASNNPIGTLTSTNSRTSKNTGTVSGKTRQYIQHTSSGTASVGTDSTRWTFEWKAPSSNVGNVTFYVVINCTNSDNTNSGDIIYGKTFQFGPSNLLPVAKASSSDTVTCIGYNVQLIGGGTGSPTSYSWKINGGIPTTSNSQNQMVTFTSPGLKQAILTVKNSLGTSSPDTLNILVNQTPSATIGNGSAGSVCKGDSIQLSANTGANIVYEWQHNNSKSRTVYVKDTQSYAVKVTSVTNGCFRISAPFKLSWYDDPSISITKTSTSDTFCSQYNETFTASGNLIDSVHWYVNGVLSRRTKSLSTTFTGTNSIQVFALAKSINNCMSTASNTLKLASVPLLYPSNFSSSKTTSTIHLKWKRTTGITAYSYALNGANFIPANTDSSIDVSGLQPNTFYKLTLRSTQKSPCLFSDTSFTIKTNACSNLQYSVDFNPRACKGESMPVTVRGLYAAKFRIAFNQEAFSADTTYSFNAIQSDTLKIYIVDSLSPTCPAIEEFIAYTVDTLFDKDTSSGAKKVNVCVNNYTFTAVSGYSMYAFYKNNVLEQSQSTPEYTYTGLTTGDKLTVVGTINTCSRTYGPLDITVNSLPDANYTFTRNWKVYTFTADDLSLATYTWKAGADILGNGSSFLKDLSVYNDSDIDVVLITESAAGCKDSSTQNITVPNLNSLSSFGNEKVKVFPNPFSQTLSISHELETYQIEVIDFQGKLIATFSSKESTFDINTELWSAGIYQVKLSDTNGNVYRFTVLKQ